MVDTGFAAFSTTVDRTNRVLKEIESAQLAAQFPVLIRGIYYDGWDPSRVPQRMDRDEFMGRVRREFSYDVEGGMPRLVQTVLHSLGPHVTEGEWEDIRAGMPSDLAAVVSA